MSGPLESVILFLWGFGPCVEFTDASPLPRFPAFNRSTSIVLLTGDNLNGSLAPVKVLILVHKEDDHDRPNLAWSHPG